jgi:hypothetical protein
LYKTCLSFYNSLFYYDFGFFLIPQDLSCRSSVGVGGVLAFAASPLCGVLINLSIDDCDLSEADDPVHNGDKSTEIQPLVENTEATTSKPEALPVSKTSNGNNKQHANKSGPQKTVKMTNSDNNTDKSQSSIDL